MPSQCVAGSRGEMPRLNFIRTGGAPPSMSLFFFLHRSPPISPSPKVEVLAGTSVRGGGAKCGMRGSGAGGAGGVGPAPSPRHARLLALAVLLVGLVVHEGVELGVLLGLDLGEPAVLLGRLVQERRLVAERLVDRDNLAAQRRVDVRRGLDRLDGADRLCAPSAGCERGVEKGAAESQPRAQTQTACRLPGLRALAGFGGGRVRHTPAETPRQTAAPRRH